MAIKPTSQLRTFSEQQHEDGTEKLTSMPNVVIPQTFGTCCAFPQSQFITNAQSNVFIKDMPLVSG